MPDDDGAGLARFLASPSSYFAQEAGGIPAMEDDQMIAHVSSCSRCLSPSSSHSALDGDGATMDDDEINTMELSSWPSSSWVELQQLSHTEWSTTDCSTTPLSSRSEGRDDAMAEIIVVKPRALVGAPNSGSEHGCPHRRQRSPMPSRRAVEVPRSLPQMELAHKATKAALREFESAFELQHGRRPRTKRDWLPVYADYKRYEALRHALRVANAPTIGSTLKCHELLRSQSQSMPLREAQETEATQGRTVGEREHECDAALRT